MSPDLESVACSEAPASSLAGLTLRAALAEGARLLDAARVEDAGLEAEVLLRHVLGLGREAFLQRLREPLQEAPARRYEALLRRRLAHEPTAYITARREFSGLDLEVGPAVLIPRPETELLVEAAIELARPRSRIRRGPIVADVGTGSGAIAIAIAANVPRVEVYAIDISAAALSLAAANARRHAVEGKVTFLRGDLVSPLPEFVDVLVANLPYVTTPDWERLSPEVRDFEPRSALDGGADGLDLVRRFLAEAPAFLRPGGALCLEFGAGQTPAVTAAAAECFPRYRLEVRKDLAGIDRVLIIAP